MCFLKIKVGCVSFLLQNIQNNLLFFKNIERLNGEAHLSFFASNFSVFSVFFGAEPLPNAASANNPLNTRAAPSDFIK